MFFKLFKLSNIQLFDSQYIEWEYYTVSKFGTNFTTMPPPCKFDTNFTTLPPPGANNFLKLDILYYPLIKK